MKGSAASGLITSEAMQRGARPRLFTGGTCMIQTLDGPIRNPGRDRLAAWLDARGWTYFEPQIHPETHGRSYIWELDGPQEKIAREHAELRVYEINPSSISAVSALEILDDARRERPSVVWLNGGPAFQPIGLGDVETLRRDDDLSARVGPIIYHHLVAYANAGRQIRRELISLLEDSPTVSFVASFEELTRALERELGD